MAGAEGECTTAAPEVDEDAGGGGAGAEENRRGVGAPSDEEGVAAAMRSDEADRGSLLSPLLPSSDADPTASSLLRSSEFDGPALSSRGTAPQVGNSSDPFVGVAAGLCCGVLFLCSEESAPRTLFAPFS